MRRQGLQGEPEKRQEEAARDTISALNSSLCHHLEDLLGAVADDRQADRVEDVGRQRPRGALCRILVQLLKHPARAHERVRDRGITRREKGASNGRREEEGAGTEQPHGGASFPGPGCPCPQRAAVGGTNGCGADIRSSECDTETVPTRERQRPRPRHRRLQKSALAQAYVATPSHPRTHAHTRTHPHTHTHTHPAQFALFSRSRTRRLFRPGRGTGFRHCSVYRLRARNAKHVQPSARATRAAHAPVLRRNC